MIEFYSENFITSCSKGEVEECKKLLSQQVDVNYSDKDGNSGIFHAAINNQPEVLRLLDQNNASFDLTNRLGNTPLHYACEKNYKEIIFNLLLAGVDPLVANNEGKKAGDGNIEAMMFVNSIMGEKKAFKVLNPLQKRKLIMIFEDIDGDNQKSIDLNKSLQFNKYIDDSVNESLAKRDAEDFIKSCAILDKTKVNLDEWLFAFSKLLVLEPQLFDKFIEDYDKAVETKGKLRNWKPE